MSTVNATSYRDASGGGNAVLFGVAAPANSMGFRNRIINGDMRIAQRGTSTSVGGSDTYTLDRWAGIAAGANFTVTQGSLATRNVMVATGASGNTLADMLQRIESLNAIDLASTPCTVSLDLFSSDGRSVAWEVYSANSPNVFGSKTLISSGTLTTTAGSYVPKTLQFTATAAAVNGLELRFKFGALGSGAQCALSDVQLEAGSVASPFERIDYGRELSMCQRYFEISEATFYGPSGATNYFPVQYVVPKRTTPTVTITGPGTITGSTAGTTVFTPRSEMFYITNTGIVGGSFASSAEL